MMLVFVGKGAWMLERRGRHYSLGNQGSGAAPRAAEEDLTGAAAATK